MFFITSSSSLIFFTYITWTLTTVNGVKWPTAEQEALDEMHDIEIIKAVQTSMSEWKIKSHKHRRKRADKSVCYGDLGCFEDSGPFGYLEMLPSTPKEIDTKFLIYSTKNRGDRPVLEFSYFDMSSAWGDGDLNINNNNINNDGGSNNSTTPQTTTETSAKQKISAGALVEDLGDLSTTNIRVIAHGFGSSCSHVWIYEMRTALMAVEDCIVICIDWENGATLPNYVRAAANTRLVGKQLAMLLNGMVDYNGLNMSRVHIIGFSLGAHVAGFAGAELPHLSRITGLDPAGPLFESQHPKVRLDSTDATFVDVIHSNGENLILGGLGSWQPMGHVDFYPNGGRVQHGCSNLFVGAVTDFIWSPAASIEGRSLCNHRRAYKFFIDSVAPRCLFPAFPCDSYDHFLQGKCFPCDQTKENATSHCGNMGYYADRSTGLGQLYLLTREEEPFCAHQYNVELHSSENDLPLRTLGRLEVTLEGDGGLNETFTITEKDDTEFFAGEVISRILVPHPALGFPTRMTLTYKAYSGWLSRGLHNWSVYKVMLTDSFGKSYSLCKRSFNLGSGISIKLELLPGNCEIPEEIKIENVIDSNSTDIDRYDKPEETTNKNLIKLDENHKIVKNYSYVFADKSNLVNIPWQPMLEGNSLIDKDNVETSRSFAASDDQQIGEIYEPILKDRKIHKERKLHIRESDITEPILKSTTPKVHKTTNDFHVDNAAAETTKTARSDTSGNKRGRESRLVTVQLFPFRLGELLERAERYARQTLLPLITVQAPRFLGFGVPTENDDDRDAKSYPLPDVKSRGLRKNIQVDGGDETTFYPGASDLTTEGLNPTDDNLIPDSTQKNLFELLRENQNSPRVIQQRSISTDYYTNLNFDNPDAIKSKRVKPTKLYQDFDDDDDSKEVGLDLTMVKIDLPTYKPPIGFPYLFEVPLEQHTFTNKDTYENPSPPPPPVTVTAAAATTTEKSKFIPLIYATNDESTEQHIKIQDNKTIRSR